MTMVPLGAQDPVAVGSYQLLQVLGEGGMGKVYLARSPGSRLVALKVIRPEYADDPSFRERFRREADAAARVSGFFTTPVIDADADGPQPWMATSYVPAPSLIEVVRGLGVLMPEPALRALGAGLSEALLAIHAAGLVHRDLKPGNVLVAGDGPRVIDFGISRALDGTHVTRTGGVIGTPGFMSPEQISSGREVGFPSDVFSLGCVLVFAAIGSNPFSGGDAADLLYKAVHDEPCLDGVPDGLRPLIAACLEKDPAKRPAVSDVLNALTPANPGTLLSPKLQVELQRRWHQTNSIISLPASTLRPPGTLGQAPDRRRFLGIAVAVGGVGLAAVGGVIALLETGGGSGAKRKAAGSNPTPAAAPPGPSPTWTTPASSNAFQIDPAQLQLAGATVVWWNPGAALGIDPGSGSQRWTGGPDIPNGGNTQWWGVYGSTLYGTAITPTERLIIGLDGSNKEVARAKIGPGYMGGGSGLALLLAAGSGVALVAASQYQTSGMKYLIQAVEVSSGKSLWQRTAATQNFQAVIDGQRCYLQDEGTTYGLDLRTGATLWNARNTASTGVAAGSVLTLAAGILMITGGRVIALDTATGHQAWTAINQGGLINAAGAGDQLYVADVQGRVWALDARTGNQIWSTSSPLGLSVGLDVGFPERRTQGMSVSDSLIAIPIMGKLSSGPPYGVIVLQRSSGKVLWARQDTTGLSPWTVLAVGSTVYAASPTDLYAFKGRV